MGFYFFAASYHAVGEKIGRLNEHFKMFEYNGHLFVLNILHGRRRAIVGGQLVISGRYLRLDLIICGSGRTT
mgnify:CR=1 FL=1